MKVRIFTKEGYKIYPVVMPIQPGCNSLIYNENGCMQLFTVLEPPKTTEHPIRESVAGMGYSEATKAHLLKMYKEAVDTWIKENPKWVEWIENIPEISYNGIIQFPEYKSGNTCEWDKNED